MIENQYTALKQRANQRFEEFAKHYSPISMAASPETGTMLWFLLHTLKPDLLIETGSGYTTALIAEWIQDQATISSAAEPNGRDGRPTVYHVEEFQEWKQSILNYLKSIDLEPGIFINYPDLYQLTLNKPFFALLDGLRSERPTVVRYLIDSGAAVYGVLLIDDAQTDTNEEVQESLDLLDLSNQGLLYDLTPWTFDVYGRSARLFIGYQSGFDAHLLYEMDQLRPEVTNHRSVLRDSSPFRKTDTGEGAASLPLISIIITCYNKAPYIKESIESALAQTYAHCEIIVVNDGSTDESLQVINDCASRFPGKITVINKEHQGVSKTRDAGVDVASGRYVVLLDGDDLLFPTALQTWFDFAQSHPEYAVVYSNAIRFDERGIVTAAHIPRQQRLKLEGDILSSHLGWGVVTSTALIDRAEILKAGSYSFALSLKGHDDFFMYVRLLLAGCKFGYADQYTLLYRDLEKTLSKNIERGNQFKYAALQFAYANHIDKMVAAAQELTMLGLAERTEKEDQRLAHRQTLREYSLRVELLEAERQKLSQQVQKLEEQLTAMQTTHDQRLFQDALRARDLIARSGLQKSNRLAYIRRRSSELLHRAQIVLREQGLLELTNRTLRWLGGERRTLGRVQQMQVTVNGDGKFHLFDPLADYPQWIAENEPGADELETQRQHISAFTYQPLMSVLTPVYNTDLSMLTEMIDSVCAQTYPHWELCLVDGGSSDPMVWQTLQRYAAQDTRIKIQRLEQNLGISGNSNAALALVSGEYITLLDHDDTLAPFALYEVVKRLNADPTLDFIYSDRDTMRQEGTRYLPLFKPQWSPDMLFNANYLTHVCVLRTSMIRQIGGFKPQSDGAQDWMLFLEAAARTTRFGHIPQILYHWREHSRSTSSGMHAKPYAAKGQIYAVQNYLDALQMPAQANVEAESVIRIDWHIDPVLKVSIVVDIEAGMDASKLKQTLHAWLKDSPGLTTEWIILNRSATRKLGADVISQPAFAFMKLVEGNGASRAAALNCAVAQSTGDVLVFVSAALSPVNPLTIQQLVGWTRHPQIGVVGGRLLQPDGTIASIGQTLHLGGVVGSFAAGLSSYSNTLLGHTIWYRNFSAISGDCMAIRRAEFEAMGGFDGTFQSRGWDVDLCLRLLDKGLRHIYTPFAVLRYATAVPTTWEVSETDDDAAMLRSKHRAFFESDDRYYNRNLSRTHVVPRLALKA